MDKVVGSPEKAVSDIADGAVVALGGFGLAHRFPNSLLFALRDRGSKDLTVVCNSLGGKGEKGQLLAENRQIKKLMTSFSIRPRMVTAAEEQILSGEMEVELIPQGILVERCRAAGAGIPAFYSPAGTDTPIAEGKDVRYFEGRAYILERAIHLDFALINAYRADKAGNIQFRGSNRHLSLAYAKAAKVTIVEVEEIVETGEIPSELIDLPGIFVHRVVKTKHLFDFKTVLQANRRGSDTARTYHGKRGLTRSGMARNAAKLLRDGTYVNLGTGIPLQIANFLGKRDIWLHAENGLLGYGGIVTGDDVDPDVYSAGGQFVSPVPGTSFFDSVTSFEMARGGHIDTVVLGAYQVDQHGDLANWSASNPKLGGIGGAMDLVSGCREVIVVLEHWDSKNCPKLLKQCTYPLTGRRCVNRIVTDLAMLNWRDDHFVLEAVTTGFSPTEVIEMTEMTNITIASSVRVMNRPGFSGELRV